MNATDAAQTLGELDALRIQTRRRLEGEPAAVLLNGAYGAVFLATGLVLRERGGES